MHDADDDLLIGDVARELGISVARVRQMSDRGELASRRAGSRGTRLFRNADVEALRDQRAARKTAGRATEIESGK